MTPLLTITNTIGGLSLLVNLALLFLISIRLPAHLGAFKNNYYGMIVIDTLFALAQFAAAPCFFSDGNAYLIFASRPGGSLLIVFFMIMHNTSFNAISFNIFCRYLMVCSNAITKLFNGKWARRAFYLFNLGEIIVSLIAVFIVFHIPQRATKDLNDKYAESLEMNFESDFILGSSAETFSLFNYYSELLRYGSFLLFIAYGLVNISVTYLCGTGMYAYIKVHSSSNKLRSINYRVLIILTTQATMSALFVYTPGLITALFTIIGFDGSSYAQAISALMSFATLFTPAIVILLTREYRSKLVDVILRCSNTPLHARTVQSSSSTVIIQTQSINVLK